MRTSEARLPTAAAWLVGAWLAAGAAAPARAQTDDADPAGGVDEAAATDDAEEARDGGADVRPDPPLAVVVVVEGTEAYLGNEHRADGCSGTDCDVGLARGAYDVVAAALGPAEGGGTLSQAGGPSSRGALVVYGDGVDLRQPMTALADLTYDKLGHQQAYEGRQGHDLVAALHQAYVLLRDEPIERKLLVIFSDGVDPSAREVNFRELGEQLAGIGAEVEALVDPAASPEVAPAEREAGVANLRTVGLVRDARDVRQARRVIGELVERERARAVAARRAVALGAGVDAFAVKMTSGRVTGSARRRRWWLVAPVLLAVAVLALVLRRSPPR
ncbi:MAG TPA: hypothetical protein VHE35_07735 [Kofleriaceae bacterium]|nr:hypothetical protein [Kofleriaceae bacterium]